MTGPDSLSFDLGDNILLDVMVLLDGVIRERADDVMRKAASSYAPLNISLKWRTRQVAFATDDADQLISRAKREFKGVRPKGFDIVYVMTAKDIHAGGDYMVAGLADCISGVSFDDHAFAVGEDFGADEDEWPCARSVHPHLTPCTLMFNAVNFASIPFGTINAAVIRGHASDFARP